MAVLIYGYTFLFLAGIGVLFLVYLVYRRWTKGKIICYFYTPDRSLFRKSIRPDPDLHILEHSKRAYIYRQDRVLMTPGFLLKEPTPALFFDLGEVHPIDLFGKTPKRGDDGVSSAELSSILNDGTVKDFISAQGKHTVGQVLYTQVIGFGLIILAVGIGAYYILGRLGDKGVGA